MAADLVVVIQHLNGSSFIDHLVLHSPDNSSKKLVGLSVQ